MPEGSFSTPIIASNYNPYPVVSGIPLCIYNQVKIINRIDSYILGDADACPVFGDRVGIYHPLRAKIFILDDVDWQIYDYIAQHKPPLAILLDKFSGYGDLAYSRIVMLRGEGLILEQDEQFEFELTPVYDSAELYVKTTEGCNFACPGCATASDVISPQVARTLTFDTASLFLESFVRSCSENNIREADIKWAGGEPMLGNAYKVVVQSAEYIKQLQERYPEVKISQSLLTNGVFLNDEKIQFAARHGMHISVSLWGTESVQDQMRKPRNNMETFPVIVNNLNKVYEAGGSYNVNYVLTPHNYLDFPEFLSIMWDIEHPKFVGRNWANKRPIPLGINFFRPQHLIKPHIMNKQYQRMAQGLRMGYARILDMISRQIPIQPLHRIDYLDLLNLIVTPCGTGFTYIAVRPEGAASCHEGLFQMASNLERIRNGENMFTVVNEEYSGTRDLLLGPHVIFQEGELLALHGGQGCPRMARAENKGILGRAASTSQLYNEIYPELLSLEVARQSYVKQ